jgi:hypothetical protein
VESPVLLGVYQFVNVSMVLVTLRRKLNAARLVFSERIRGIFCSVWNYSFFIRLPQILNIWSAIAQSFFMSSTLLSNKTLFNYLGRFISRLVVNIERHPLIFGPLRLRNFFGVIR